MCCCDVATCCCGCNSLQKGTLIWAIVDAVFNFVLFIGTAAPLGGASPTWICFGMVFWDILLALGAHFRVTGLLIVWQIFMMMYIVLLFLMWIIIPVTLVLTIFVASAAVDSTSALSSSYGVSYGTGSITTVNSAVAGYSIAAAAVSILCLVFAVILPIVYIYFWIVVNNLRREFSRPAPQPTAIAPYPQPMYY